MSKYLIHEDLGEVKRARLDLGVFTDHGIAQRQVERRNCGPTGSFSVRPHVTSQPLPAGACQ